MGMFANLQIKQKIMLVLASFFLLLGVAIGTSWLYVSMAVGDTIYPMTTIDGIDMAHKTKQEALDILSARDEYYHDAVIEVLYNESIIATLSGQELGLERDTQTKVDQAYTIGRSSHLPSQIAQQLNVILKLRTFPFVTQLQYDKGPIEQLIGETEEFYNRDAKNALFTFENGKVISFKADEPGVKIKSEVFREAIQKNIQMISDKNKHLSITIDFEPVPPEVTLAEANELGIEELIGEGRSDYSHSIPSRIHNVILAAIQFDGVIIPKGETFSFVKIIGDISASTGYQQAYIIKDGRTVLGDGGGVCQVSTTMFRAAINTGLPITERHAHAYRVSYYENDSEPGFDATIFSPTVDLKFMNNTPGAILIQMEIDKEKQLLVYKFYGKKDGRSISISPATVWGSTPPPEALYEDDPTLKTGVVKQVDYAAWGAKTKFEYKVTSSSGEVMEEKTFLSAFRPWQAVFLRGTGE